ncbi:MAG TPA: choice-of-anchor I family protein [Methylomirabilota bacterium]|nr:choice-of-anchor I family protein [Methylomirabilota bacterium]
MKSFFKSSGICVAGALLALCVNSVARDDDRGITLKPIGTYSSGIFNAGGAEIVAHDPDKQRLYVVNAQAATVDVLDIRRPTRPTKIRSLEFSALGGVANSVAVHDGLIAVAIEAVPKTDPGHVVLLNDRFRTLAVLEVGAQPDMLRFSPNGRWLLTANEGEPNSYLLPDSVDPEGTVSIIDLEDGADDVKQSDVRTVNFHAFEPPATLAPSIRIFGPGATVSQDLEPEYIAISEDSKTAWVTLQENNALAIIDIKSAKVKRLVGLGFKEHNRRGNGLDPSDRDNAAGTGPEIKIGRWPVFGLYQPDAIASYRVDGDDYIVMANEGDAREWPNVNAISNEVVRVGALNLDPGAFPDPGIKTNSRLGRLQVTSTLGDFDEDGDYDALFAFGARSFSIRDAKGKLVFDSGDDLENITALANTNGFNTSSTGNAVDSRSPAKGPEPEGLTIGKAYDKTYAFICLERVGGIAAYDISRPEKPKFEYYVNRRDFSVNVNATNFLAAGDLGPEGIIFISAKDSPNDKPLVVVANEISGTTTIFQIDQKKKRDDDDD